MRSDFLGATHLIIIVFAFVSMGCSEPPSGIAEEQLQDPTVHIEAAFPIPILDLDAKPGGQLSSCKPELRWWATHESYGMPVSTFFQFSPNSALLTAASDNYWPVQTVYRAGWGAALISLTDEHLYRRSRDTLWTLESSLDSSGKVQVWDLLSESTVMTVEVPADALSAQAHALHPHQQTLFTAHCSTPETVTLREWDLQHQSLQSEHTIDNLCQVWQASLELVPLAGHPVILMLNRGQGTLTRLDLESGQTHTVQTYQESLDVWGRWLKGLGIELNPDEHTVATIGADARLRRWALPGLEPLDDDGFKVGISEINANLYAEQFLASPAAFSPDGLLFAHVDPEPSIDQETPLWWGGPERGVLLRRSDTGALVATLQPESDHPSGEPAHPVEIDFAPDGRSVAVLFNTGVGVWTCPDAVWPLNPTPVTLHAESVDGPRRLDAGQPGEWHLSALPGVFSRPVTLLLMMDGEPVDATLAPTATLSWTPKEAGHKTLSLVADDGLRRGEVSWEVDVLPAKP